MVLTDGGGVQGKAVGRPLLMTECTGDATGDLVLYLLGVMYRGALGIRLFRGLGVSGCGIFDGVVRGDVDTPVETVDDTFDPLKDRLSQNEFKKSSIFQNEKFEGFLP